MAGDDEDNDASPGRFIVYLGLRFHFFLPFVVVIIRTLVITTATSTD
jgi:hypothetical protein